MPRFRPPARLAVLGLVLVACAGQRAVRRIPPEPGGASPGGHAVEGLASWYGPGFAGRLTASGEVYDPRDLTAAHRTLPFGTRLLVRNLDNGRTCWVRINDRGPFVAGRIIDLSYSAAQALGVVGPGTARVALERQAEPPAADGVVAAPTAVALPPAATEAAPPPTAPEEPLPEGGWTVQVGAFAVDGNAERLARDLARRGLDSRVREAGELSRVEVGSFRSHDEAQALAEALRRDGFEAAVRPAPQALASGLASASDAGGDAAQ